MSLTQILGKTSLCEWKGRATYWNLKLANTNEEVKSKIWSYESPTTSFQDIKGFLSVYASGVPWDCFVDDEKVQPQEGEFASCSSKLCSDMSRRLLWRMGDQRTRGAHEGRSRHLGVVRTRADDAQEFATIMVLPFSLSTSPPHSPSASAEVC